MALAGWPRRVVPLALFGMISATGGCSLVAPYHVHGKESEYWNAPGIVGAIKYAQSSQRSYRQALDAQAAFNVVTAGLIIGAAAAAAGLGIAGVAAHKIAALGIAGAGLFGIHSFVYSAPRQRIFAAGVTAIDCALKEYGTLHALAEANVAQLRGHIERLNKDIPALEALLEAADRAVRQARRNPGDVPEIRRGRAVLDTARAAQSRGVTALQRIGRAGAELYFAVRQIEGKITEALTRTEPDLSVLMSSLGAIRVNASIIADRELVPRPPAAVTGAAVRTRIDPQLQEDLRLKTNSVEADAAAVNRIVDEMGTMPSATKLETCLLLQPEKFGFFTSPSTNLVIESSARETSGVIAISGGEPPYVAEWVNQVPDGAIALQPVDHSAGGPLARVAIKVAPNTPAATLSLRIADRNGFGKVIQISIRSAVAAGRPSTGEAPLAPDPVVIAIQMKLIEKKCLLPKIDGKDSIDGYWGGKTIDAAEKFMQTAAPDAGARKNMFGGESARTAPKAEIRNQLMFLATVCS